MSSDSCDTYVELSDEQVVRALVAVTKGMKPSLAATFLSRGSNSLASLITRIISAAFHHRGESTEVGLNLVEEMRSKPEFAAALLASLANIQQTFMTSPHWEKIPVILASIYHRWITVQGVLALISDILVKWVCVDVEKDDENVNLFNCKTFDNFCDDIELKFRQVDCAESLLTVIGQNLFKNNPDGFEALYNEIRSHLLKEDCDVRDKLLRMVISMALVSDGIFENRNIAKKQTAPKIQQESGTNSGGGPSITTREVVDKYLADWNAIQNDEFIDETIEHDETEDEESGRLHSRTTAENNPLIEDICETEFDNVGQTRIELVSPSHFEMVKFESTTFSIAKTEKQEPHRIEKTGPANRFNLKQNQVPMESSLSDDSSDEEFVEITRRMDNFRRDGNNFTCNNGELNQTDEVNNPMFAEAMAEEISQHLRYDKFGGRAPSLEKKGESFNSNSGIDFGVVEQINNEGENKGEGNVLDNKETLRQGSLTSPRFVGLGGTLSNMTRNGESSDKNATDVEINVQDGRDIILEVPEAMENLHRKVPSQFVLNMIHPTSEVAMDIAKLKSKTDKHQVGNALKYQQTTSPCKALGYLVPVVTEAAVARELMCTNKYPVTDGAIIGRTAQCDVVISSKTVSRTQANIYREGEQVFFETMSKTNASLVNNIPVHCHSGPIRINSGYTIQVGEVTFVWEEVGRCFEQQNYEGKCLIEKGGIREVSGLKDTNACIQQSDHEAAKDSASTVTAISDCQHVPRADDVLDLAQKANLGAVGTGQESKLGRASGGRRSVAARLEADVKRCWKKSIPVCQSANGKVDENPEDATTADANSTKANRCDKTVSHAIPNTIIDASTFHNEFSNQDIDDNHDESLNPSLPPAHNISFFDKFLNVYQHKRKALKIPKRVPDVNTCRDGGRKSARIRSGRRQCVVNTVPQGPRGTDRQLMIISRHYVEQDQVFSSRENILSTNKT